MSFTIPIQVIGEGALSILSKADTGKVLASVTGAIYLADQQDEVFWLIPPGGMMHRRGIQAAGLTRGVKAGMLFTVECHTLMISSSNCFDFGQSLVWKSPNRAAIVRFPLRIAFDSLVEMIDQLLNSDTPKGFGRLVRPILQMSLMDAVITEGKNITGVARRAWPSIQGIIHAYAAGDILLWKKCAQTLAGLGEGLTPSGDDFLGGFIFASRLFARIYPDKPKIPDSTYSDFIEQAKSLTNLISFTVLKDHAEGESLAALDQLADGLLTGKPSSQLLVDIKQLISVGHSTGWDILAGFTGGMVASLMIYPA